MKPLPSPRLDVRSKSSLKRLREPTLAWAKDIRSGRLRYIMELGSHERGRSCDCACVSCHKRLIAVNAATSQYDRRSHFRHESGTETQNCQILSSRAALLATLQEGDLIILPHRRHSVWLRDLALTAWRCGDVAKILKRVLWSYRGEEYLARIENDLCRIDAESQRFVKRTIAEIRLNKSGKSYS